MLVLLSVCSLASGADVLFEDPSRRSTSVGVTVSPVRIASIEQFGDLATVGQRLLEAEGKKVRQAGTFGATISRYSRYSRLSS